MGWPEEATRKTALASWTEDLEGSAVAKLLENLQLAERFRSIVSRFIVQ